MLKHMQRQGKLQFKVAGKPLEKTKYEIDNRITVDSFRILKWTCPTKA